jgi:hypothetical protein
MTPSERPSDMTAELDRYERAGDGNRTRMTSLEGRWRSLARRQGSGPVLLATGVRGGGVTVTDRRLPSCVARMWHG